jgi:hypothetical protein
MAGIFINYRRDDAPGVAGRLFDYLALKFPHRSLFMDVDAMKPGMDFAKQLDTQVSQCQVVLAVIGPHWLDAKDKTGHRRLDGDKDYVRIELASALKRDIPVIPILVDGAVMPTEDNLSDDLKSLAFRHALELRHTRFNADADAIVHALEGVVPRRSLPWLPIGAGIAVAAIALLAVLWPKISAKLHPGAAPPAIVAVNPPAAVSPAQPAAPPKPAAAPATPAATVASVLGAATPAALPAGTKIGDMMTGFAFRGFILDFRKIKSDPAVCQAACQANQHCAVWTYTQPANEPDQIAGCSLKAVIPPFAADTCCTSAVERAPDPQFSQPPPIPAGMTGAVAGVALEGGTYSYFVGGTESTPDGCQAKCRSDGQCTAWDYLRPGIAGAEARCFLKNRAVNQVANPCCIAGFEQHAAASPPAASPTTPAPAGTAAAAASAPLLNTNLRGADYRGFDPSADNWSPCQSACKAEAQCLAWTYLRPGVQGPNAKCWLKNKIPQPTANSCCTSGIERAEPK